MSNKQHAIVLHGRTQTRDRIDLIHRIYATAITNPCFVHYAHVHKMHQNTIVTWAKTESQGAGEKRSIQLLDKCPHIS